MCSASSAAEGKACAETSHAVVDRGGTAGNTKTVASLLLQVEGLSRLVEDLRTLSLAIGQKLVMDRERFELADLVDAVLNAAKPMLDASKLAVEKELVPMEAVADCQCIRQAMLALLENSCRFAASGGILRCQTELVADGFIAIHIHDRGPGFPENTGEVTVNPFWRGDTSRSRATGGTGLGLSVVQAITTAHSEKLEFCNRPGGGATVSILIPREFTECPS